MTPSGRIVLTREEQQNKQWAADLENMGHKVIEIPMLRFELLSCDPQIMTESYQWILFTSIQGVRAFMELELDPGPAKFGALGDGTAQALLDFGLADTLNVRGKDGVEMAENFVTRFSPPGKILLPGAKLRLSAPRSILAAAGFSATELPLYKTMPIQHTPTAENVLTAEDLVFFCSPSAVHSFTDSFPTLVSCVAIGETTARACRQAGLHPIVSHEPTFEAMVQAAGLDSSCSPVQPEIES